MTEGIKICSTAEFEAKYPDIYAKKYFYSKATATKVVYAAGAGVAFVSYCADREGVAGRFPWLVNAYKWNAKNNVFYYSYPNEEKAAKSAETFLNNCLEHKKSVAERRAARSGGHSLKVGDILCASWGYEQTNVDYYKVTKTTKCTVDLVKIGKKSAGADRVSPDPSVVMAEKTYTKKRVNDKWVRVDDVRRASLVAPNSTTYETPWNMGH